MRYVDEFRDPVAAARLVDRIRRTATRRWTIMEVCGGQTHSLLRHGIDQELAGEVELIHGPGCPVCVTPVEAIDRACDLARRAGTTVASFGDMLRVPGARGSLAQAAASGGSVRAVYSPLDAVELARRTPDRQIVFLAVGFETTAPATALAVLQAAAAGLMNFSVLAAHVCVRPAMERLAADPERRLQAFLAAGHAATITGCRCYESTAAEYGVPVVVTGFEPFDLLDGILGCIEQLEAGRAEVENRYARSVRRDGNPEALRLLERVYRTADGPWRGLGVVPQGRLELREEYAPWDARRKFGSANVEPGREPAAESGEESGDEPGECQAAAVLAGRIKPTGCPAFGVRCRPDSPLGAPMVSTEGACAAYFRYGPPEGGVRR